MAVNEPLRTAAPRLVVAVTKRLSLVFAEKKEGAVVGCPEGWLEG